MNSPKLSLLKPILGDELANIILENLRASITRTKGFTPDRSYANASINVNVTVIVDSGRELTCEFRAEVRTMGQSEASEQVQELEVAD